VKGTGAFRERLVEAWVEIRENLGRSSLQAIGVVLGVASVLGGFSISDSQRKRSDELYVRMGGLHLADEPFPERERLGVRIVDAEDPHAFADPEQHHIA
jgi:hypothetical protein